MVQKMELGQINISNKYSKTGPRTGLIHINTATIIHAVPFLEESYEIIPELFTRED